MAERLATRPETRQEAAPSDTDAVFEDIVGNFDQELGERNTKPQLDVRDTHEATLISDEESAALNDMEAHLKGDDSTDEDPDASPQSLVVTQPIPTTPAPTQTPPQSPPTQLPTNVQTQTADPNSPIAPQSPPPLTPEKTPVDLQPRTSEFTMVMVDQSKDARDFARDAADARLTKELNEGGKFRRFLKGIWKGNVAREYYRQQYIREAQAQIEAGQDVLVHETGDQSQRTRAQMSTIERFQSEHRDMLINNGAEEKAGELVKDSELALGLKGVIRDFVEGKLTNEGLKEERNRVIEAYRAKYGDAQVGEGLVRIDNMLDIAESVKGAIEHGESLDHVMANMKIITGEARTGARSEASHNKADTVIEWLGKRKLLSAIPDSAIAAATAVATGILKVGSTKTLSAVFKTLLPGVGSAIIAGVRETVHLKKERTQHMREVAMGKEMTPPPEPKGRLGRFLQRFLGNRREQLEATRYNTESAVDLTSRLREQQNNILMDDADRKAGQTKDDALREALAQLAAVEARTLIADTQKKDLISFSDVAKVNDERLQLALARAELKVLLTKELDDATKARLQLDANHTINDLINNQAGKTIELISDDISAKDKAFKSLRNRRVAKMAAIGLGTGLLLGMGAQEAVAAFDGTRVGVFEQMAGHQVDSDGLQHQTLLRGMVHGDGPEHFAASTEMGEPSKVGDHGTLQVSKDHNLVRNPDGTFNLVDPNGKASVENLKMNPDGTMPPESKDLLSKQGMNVDTSASFTTFNETRQPVDLNTFMENRLNNGEATHVTRDLWYDNNTPAPVFDKNELGLHRGGINGTGITAEGNYQVVAAMTGEGSYHNEQAANYLELAREGKLKMAISPTAGTQNTPLMVEMKVAMVPDEKNPGKMVEAVVADVDPKSPAGQFLANDNGNLELNGRYAEFVQMGNVDNEGVQHIRPLATWVGRDIEVPLTDIVKTPEFHPITKITTGGYEGPGTFTEMAPTNFVNSRRAIEVVGRRPWRNPEQPGTPNNYNYYPGAGEGGWYPGYFADLEQDRMPELRRDPSARIRLIDGLRWHYDRTRSKDPAYAQEIENLVGTMPNMANLDVSTECIVPILVGANMEHDNIYRTLSLYAQQPDSWKQATQLLLHVNWIDSKEKDPVEKAKIDKTKSEIERAMRDFPDLKISQFESIWSQDKLDNGEYGGRLIGHAAQRMYDVAMAAARQAIDAGRMPEDHDILIWKGDADGHGMARFAGPKMLKAFKEHPEVDTFSGGVRWGTELYRDLPGLGFLMTFMEMYRINAQRAHIKGYQSTFGVNAGIRLSTLGAVSGIGHYSDQAQTAPDDLALGDRTRAARNGITSGGGVSQPYGASGSSAGENDYHMHVGGTSIDTDASRFEKAYTSGDPLTAIWVNVNQNGYQTRTTGLVAGQKEDLSKNPDEVIDRIETNMSDMISHWTTNPPQISSTLAAMLPGPSQLGGVPAYRIVKQSNGTSTFNLTPQGKKWLVHRMQFNSAGKADHYGDRQARQLYGKLKRFGRGRIRAKQRPSRMVAGRV